ncbi:MAG: FAD-binding oxidoreductase [Bacilli bacterium]
MNKQDLIEEFKQLLTPSYVLTSPVDLNNYSYDASPLKASLPLVVLQPQTTQQVSEIVILCNKYLQPLIVRGSGSNLCGATIPSHQEVIVDMKYFNEIEEIDLENLTITVQAGCITQDIANYASEFGLLYPPDPGSV